MFQTAFDLISDRVYPYFWKYRHLWSKGWPERYLSDESLKQPHRRKLCDAIQSLEPFNSIMEYGCGPGANLMWFTHQFPWANIYGVDVSKRAIEAGRKAIPNVEFMETIPDNLSVDILVTDASLLYMKEFNNINKANKGYVGCEWHAECDEPFTFGRHWVHNFRKLLPGCEIKKLKWDVPDEGWDKYGHIITWKQTKEVTQHG